MAVENVEQLEISYISGKNVKWFNHWKDFGSFL